MHSCMNSSFSGGIYYGKNDAKNIRKRELRVCDDAVFDLGSDNRCKNNRFLRQKRKKNEKIIKNTCENDAACV